MTYEVRCTQETSDNLEEKSQSFPWTQFERAVRMPVVVSDQVPPGIVQLWDNNRLVDEFPFKE